MKQVRQWLSALSKALCGRRQTCHRLSSAERAGVLIEACLYIRTGQFDSANGLLLQLDDGDAARLNLLGAIHEMRKEWDEAKKCYGQAIRADRRFPPPQQNMRRWYELVTFGKSSLPILLGDEEPHWWCERAPNVEPAPVGVNRFRVSVGARVGSHRDN
jgi:hypothetical protein